MGQFDAEAAARVLIVKYGRDAERRTVECIARLRAEGNPQRAADLERALNVVDKLQNYHSTITLVTQ
jgi:hypothetical protein